MSLGRQRGGHNHRQQRRQPFDRSGSADTLIGGEVEQSDHR
ncbi:MAG: hypothetical protein R3C05_12270 [Pirellulaceae bacterium]